MNHTPMIHWMAERRLQVVRVLSNAIASFVVVRGTALNSGFRSQIAIPLRQRMRMTSSDSVAHEIFRVSRVSILNALMTP